MRKCPQTEFLPLSKLSNETKVVFNQTEGICGVDAHFRDGGGLANLGD